MNTQHLCHNNIRACRERVGLSQTELAEQIGIKGSSPISNWESGNTYPEVSNLILLSDVLNVSIDELLGRQTDTHHPEREYPDISQQEQADCDNILHQTSDFIHSVDSNTRLNYKKYIECFFSLYHSQRSAVPNNDDFPFFLGKTSPEYDINKYEAKELFRLKLKSTVTYEDIHKHLISISPTYQDHLCLGYVIGVFTGGFCPSRKLLYDIRSYLIENRRSKRKEKQTLSSETT